MPYISEHIEPDLALEWNEISIWHTYADDDYEQGPERYCFTTDPEETDSENMDSDVIFDVRDLPLWEDLEEPVISLSHGTKACWEDYWKSEPAWIAAMLCAAIEKGLVPLPECCDEPEGCELAGLKEKP